MPNTSRKSLEIINKKACKCGTCNRRFSSRWNLARHISTIDCVKVLQHPYRCPLCSETRKSLSNLHSHGNFKHKEEIVKFKKLLQVSNKTRRKNRAKEVTAITEKAANRFNKLTGPTQNTTKASKRTVIRFRSNSVDTPEIDELDIKSEPDELLSNDASLDSMNCVSESRKEIETNHGAMHQNFTIDVKPSTELECAESLQEIMNIGRPIFGISSIVNDDEHTVFGNFIATELRNMKTDQFRRKLKRALQKCLLDVTEEEHMAFFKFDPLNINAQK